MIITNRDGSRPPLPHATEKRVARGPKRPQGRIAHPQKKKRTLPHFTVWSGCRYAQLRDCRTGTSWLRGQYGCLKGGSW